MASSTITKALALFLSLTLLSSTTLVSACGSCGTPVAKPPPPPTPKPTPCTPPTKPTPSSPPKPAKCPLNTLKLGVCGDLLGLVNVIIGSPPSAPCCSLIKGLTDLQAALCLCTALKANVLGINLNVPISLSVILDTCSKTTPTGFQCP